MQGLLLRLSRLDADAENAVRLISFFDTLVEQRVDLENLLRAAARIAECPVGLAPPPAPAAPGRPAPPGPAPGGAVPSPAVSAGATAYPDGTVSTDGPPPGAAVRALATGHRAWLARGGTPYPLDQLLLERLAIAAVAVLGRLEASRASLGDPALLEIAISRTAPVPERARALHLLGVRPDSPVTPVAVSLAAAGRGGEPGRGGPAGARGVPVRRSGAGRPSPAVLPHPAPHPAPEPAPEPAAGPGRDTDAAAVSDPAEATGPTSPTGPTGPTSPTSPTCPNGLADSVGSVGSADSAGPVRALAALRAVLAPGGRWSRHTPLGGVHAVVVAGAVPGGLLAPPGTRIGVGSTVPAIDAPRAWDGAVHALRFAGTARTDAGLPPRAEEPAVYQDDLGAFELLARALDRGDIAEIADIAVLDRLAADPSGADVLAALEVVAAAGSVRAAARELHMHHNSVAARIDRAEALLGFGITRPPGQIRLALALALRRLRDNPAALHARHPAANGRSAPPPSRAGR